eukprot:s2477_g1.t1
MQSLENISLCLFFSGGFSHVQRFCPQVLEDRGANSCFIFLWPSPEETNQEELFQSIEAALVGEDRSWEKECWQLSQVPRGAVLQPLYTIAVDRQTGPRSRAAPMELKVQVLFGRVVGATLNTHPQPLWVAWNGVIQMWDSQDLVARGQVRCKSLDRCYGRSLPPQLLVGLQEALASSWFFIRDTSERLCQAAGLDELRVDWLLGDAKWGPRIGELTYMGAGSRVTPPLAMRLARAFAAGHLLRQGQMHLEDWTRFRGESQALHHRLLEVAQKKVSDLCHVATNVFELPKVALPGEWTEEMRQNAEREAPLSLSFLHIVRSEIATQSFKRQIDIDTADWYQIARSLAMALLFQVLILPVALHLNSLGGLDAANPPAEGSHTEWYMEVDGGGKEGNRANSLQKASPGGSDTEWWTEERIRGTSLRKAAPGGSDTEGWTEVDRDGKEGNRANSLRKASPGGSDTEGWMEVEGDGKEGSRANSLRKAAPGGSDTEGWTEVDGDGKEGSHASSLRKASPGGSDTEGWTEVDGDGKEGRRANSLREASPGGSDTEGWTEVDGDGKEGN